MVAPRSVKIRTNACAGTAQIVLSSCPDAVTGVAGCWIVSLSRARACRREVLPFLLPLPPNLVLLVACIVDNTPWTSRFFDAADIVRLGHQFTILTRRRKGAGEKGGRWGFLPVGERERERETDSEGDKEGKRERERERVRKRVRQWKGFDKESHTERNNERPVNRETKMVIKK